MSNLQKLENLLFCCFFVAHYILFLNDTGMFEDRPRGIVDVLKIKF